jgi:hypothetical protein
MTRLRGSGRPDSPIYILDDDGSSDIEIVGYKAGTKTKANSKGKGRADTSSNAKSRKRISATGSASVFPNVVAGSSSSGQTNAGRMHMHNVDSVMAKQLPFLVNGQFAGFVWATRLCLEGV